MTDRDALGDAFKGARDRQDDLEAKRWSAAVAERLFGQPSGEIRIGRYTVVEEIGAGANGIVFAAHDPKLNRKVAVKLLRSRVPGDRESREARLRREAQVLAQLSHPNVVPVYDVGRHDGQVFVTMEFVSGSSLRTWLEADRQWEEIVATFVQAGRGLAAAHAADVVHRDFKPDNVMVGEDGRVRVMDFGLASSPGQAAARGTANEAPTSTSLRTSLTETGTVLGTPAYMAPEQLAGEDAGPLADQFAFCVALYEALYRDRPFAGTNLLELYDSVTSGELRVPPDGGAIPKRIRGAVMRGLGLSAVDRWPSMDALVDELVVHRRPRKWAVAAVVAIVGAGIAGALYADGDDDTCPSAATKAEEIWGAQRRAGLTQAFQSVGVAYADRVLATVEPELGEYAGAWGRAYEQTCVARRVDGRRSDEIFDLEVACLADRRREFEAVVDLFAEADQEIVQQARKALDGLEPVAACADDERLRVRVPPPTDPRQRARVDELSEKLARATALLRAGKFDEATVLNEDVLAGVDSVDYDPLLVEARLLRGVLFVRTGAFEDSIPHLEAAQALAVAVRMDRAAANAAAELAYVVGNRSGDPSAGEHWVRQAAAAADRSGDPIVQARALDARAAVAMASHHMEEAEDAFAEALEMRLAALGPDHSLVANTRANVATVVKIRGEPRRALAMLREVVAQSERTLGTQHPQYAGQLEQLGITLANLRELDEARRVHLRALELKRAALGDGHPELASSLDALGNISAAHDDREKALEYYQEALAIAENAHGHDHRVVARILGNMANALAGLGRSDEARAALERGLRISETSLGSQHPQVRRMLSSLGQLAMSEGDIRNAQIYFDKVVSLSSGGSAGIDADRGLATIHFDKGDYDAAIEQMTRAVQTAESGSVDPLSAAHERFWLARAMYGKPELRAAALLIAHESVRVMGSAYGEDFQRKAAAWLADPKPTFAL